MSVANRLAILVGGGPAPGINTVISAVTLQAINEGLEVWGIEDGFKWLIRRDASKMRLLLVDDVSTIHLQGGSILGTSRDNPTKSAEAVNAVIDTLRVEKINLLVTIGGDDTALSASYIAKQSNGQIRVAHVPKTIDNDLPLPSNIPTFGFQTARHIGAQLVHSLMEDARSTRRWYIVVAMGRKAGHLALGIGKAAGATLTIIGEEFASEIISFADICTIIEGAIIKRRAFNRHFGIAVLAEGLIEKLDKKELAELQDIERDDHGNIRFAEIDLARKVKAEVEGRLSQRGIDITITNKNIGYELRCADPIPFDAVYCRDLGYHAIKFLICGGNQAMITVQDGRLVPMPFDNIRDKQTGKTLVRMVDINSQAYKVAREYMIRLEEQDFINELWVEKLARTANMSPALFRTYFDRSL